MGYSPNFDYTQEYKATAAKSVANNPKLEDWGHAVLDGAGMVPGAGIIPDAINTGWYGYEGDETNAALSAASMVPVAGLLGPAVKHSDKITKLFRGVPDWFKNKMVKDGKYVGRNNPDSYIYPNRLHADPSFEEAAKYANDTKWSRGQGVDYPKNPNPHVLEFDVPNSALPRHIQEYYEKFGKWPEGGQEVMFPEGIPKTYLKKAHNLLKDAGKKTF